MNRNLDELNKTIHQHRTANNSKIDEVISEFNNDRFNWEKERQDLIVENKKFKSDQQELKKKLEKLERAKQIFLENLKNELHTKLDQRSKI